MLSAGPLGLDPSAFDAANDGSPVDLTAKLDSGCGANTASFGTFTDTLYSVIAKKLVCGVAPSNAIATIRAAQQADGGWNFSGDPTASGADPDEIGLALMALVASGASGTDAAVQHALALLATSQQPSGAWIDFFGTAGNASSTALAALGITAAGYDVTEPCWRDTVVPGSTGTVYANPVSWLVSQQQPDGHIASPYDSFGVNTLTTSQTIEALMPKWLPIVRAPAQPCPYPAPILSTTTPVAGQVLTISGDRWAPDTLVFLELPGVLTELTYAHADATGHFSITITIPADTEPGAYELVIGGMVPNGDGRHDHVVITVVAAPTVAVPPSFAG